MSAIFLSKFYISLNDSPSKNMKNVFYFIAIAFFVLEIFKFLYFHPPLFFSLSVITLEIDIINCLNRTSITYFAWYLEKEKRYDIETLSIDRALNKEHFYGKNHTENVYQKLVPDTFLIFVNNPKQALHATSSFKNKIFWKRIIKKP